MARPEPEPGATGNQLNQLLGRWLAALPEPCGGGSGATPEAARRDGQDLLRRWAEPQRHYHTTAHLVTMLDLIDQHADLVADPNLVRLAAWFHDAVYQPKQTQLNWMRDERRSARLARRVLKRQIGGTPERAQEVSRLVLLTMTHRLEPGDDHGALLIDADLAVLSGSPEEYREYAAGVRREFSHLPDQVFTKGRTGVLQRLLEHPGWYTIFPDRDDRNRRAEHNLRAELADLTKLAGFRS